MKKGLSLLLLCLLTGSTSLPVLAQQTRKVSTTKQSVPAVETRFGEARAYSDGKGAWIEWQMEAEKDNIGFFVYRIGGSGEELVSAHKVIEGSAMRVGSEPMFGSTYSYFDANGEPGAAYIVRTASMDGKRIASAPITAFPIDDISGIAGRSSDELRAGAEATHWELVRSELLPPKKLARELAFTQTVPDLSAHDLIVRQPGVRIGVKRSGLYRVAKSQLQAAGFDVDSDPANWQLFAGGVEQAIILGPNADYIEFIGSGVSTNETDTRVYFLTVGAAAGKRMQSMTAGPGNGTASPRYGQVLVLEERSTFNDNVINGPEENYWGRAVANWGQSEILFLATGVDTTVPDAVLDVSFQGVSSGAHLFEVILNNQLIGTASGTGNQAFSNEFVIPTAALIEGENSLKLKAIASVSDFGLFDTMRLTYNRKYLAKNGQLSFFTYVQSGASVEGFTTPNVRFFETTFDSSPILWNGITIEESNGSYSAVIPSDRARQFFAVEDSAILSPLSITPNDPASLKDAAHAADLVIISYKDFLTQAEMWANYRRAQGISVKVVDVSEIYDEFNYGMMSSASIEGFLQYAVQNWQTAPRYVLLMGDASYDPRNYENRGFYNYVPTAMVNTLFTETASDEALADFNNDGLAELAIGRIPARDVQTVMTMYNKMVAWEASLSDPLDRGAIFASDLTDGWNFQAMSVRLAERLPASMPKSMIHRGDPNASATLINEINTGKYIVNFAGHGTTGSWANSFFNVYSVPQLTNAQGQSLFTMLTCLNGYFHGIWNESFAEVLTKAENGGAVAAWASTGLTTPDIQELLATRFYSQISAGNIPRLGDLIRDAKGAVNGGQDVRLSWVLIGDPMLKVR